MTGKIIKNALVIMLFSTFLLFLCSPHAFAKDADAEKAVSSEEIESMIQTLKDPAGRDKLIQQLEILMEAQGPPEKEKAVSGAAAQVLQGISGRVKTLSKAVLQIGEGINMLPSLIDWGKLQFTDTDARSLWVEVFTRVAFVIGLGYVALLLVRLFLGPLRRSLAGEEREGIMIRFLKLLGIFILDLLPVIAFALATYAVLGFVNPREQTRLILLTWVNAFVIVWVTVAVFRVVLAPAFSHLRLWGLKDETALYLDIWVHRLARIGVYGYFGLQAMVFVGLPSETYETLLRLLGMLVSAMVIVLIMQNRSPVADFISGRRGEEVSREGGRHGLLNRLAQIWHLLASVYVLLLYGVWFLKIEGGTLFLFRATVITVVIILLARTVLGFVNTLFQHGFKINDDLKSRFPGLEERANRYLSTVRKGLRALVWLLMAFTILQAWNIDIIGWFSHEPGSLLVSTVTRVLVIVMVTFVVWEFANSLIAAFFSDRDADGKTLVLSARNRTLQTVTRKALFVLLCIVSTMMILSEFGVNIGPLLAGAGVLGLAIGFGAQKLVQDVVTGIFILFENQIAVDDVVNVAGKGGLVEAVSIRSVRLRDFSGTVHVIPYSSIDTVSNMTKDFSFYVFEVGIAYREDVDEVIVVLKQIGAELQEDPNFGPLVKEPLEVAGLDSFGDSAVVIKARIKTIPVKQWAVGREFNKRMKKRFDELGIEIPFPHRTIYMGQDKEGKSPPVHVSMMQKEATQNNNKDE